MPVGARADDVEAGTEREALPERQAAVRQLIVAELGFTQCTLQRRKQVRKRLLVVPDMGATALARALADVLSLPAPDLAAFETDDRRAAQHRERAGRGVNDLWRQGRTENRIPERQGVARELIPSRKGVRPARRRIRPLGGVIVAPSRRLAGVFGVAGLSPVKPVDAAERVVPTQDETHAAGLTGLDSHAARQRPMLRLLEHVLRRSRLVIAPLAQSACPGEFTPIEAETVEPLTAEMIVDMLDAVPVRGDRKVAALFSRPVHVGRGEVQRAEIARGREDMDAAVAAVIADRRAERVIDRGLGVVLDIEAEQRRRHRRIAVVVRNERAERRHADFPRKAVVPEREFRHRKPPDEGHVVEMRHAGQRVPIGAETEAVELSRAGGAGRDALVGTVENPRVEQRAVPHRLDREMAVAVELVDRGAVADAPIDQSPGARQRQAAGPDAPERERDIAVTFAGVDETIVDGLVRRLCRHFVVLRSR